MRTEEELKDILRRCSPETLEAALAYQQRPDEGLAFAVVLGVLERFAKPEVREQVRGAGESTRFMEDLSFDSLALMEAILVVEDALEVSLSREELMDCATVSDLRRHLKGKIARGG
jgi:3-hydroxyacyl-[acyl-carrier-protein] dehydratase